MDRLWQQVLKELAAHPKQIDADSLACADWALHRRLCPAVVAALQRQKPSLSLVFAWASAREFKRALAVAERLKPTAWEYGRALWFIAVAEAEADAPPRGLRRLESIHSPSYRSDALKDIALVRIQRRRFAEALPLVAKSNSLFAYTEVTDALLKAQQLPLARTSLAQAFALAEKKKDVGQALWYLVPLQFRVGGMQEAQQRVAQISTWRELTPMRRVDLARAQAQIGDREAARRNFTLAEDEFAAIPEPELRVLRFLDLARAQFKGKDNPAAFATLNRAVEIARTLPSTGYGRNEAFRNVVAEQARAGGISEALRTLALVEDTNSKIWATSCIAEAQAEAKDIMGAKATIATLSNRFRRIDALGAIGSIQAKQGDLLGSRQTFGEAVQLALSHPEQKARSYAYSVVEAQATTGDGLGAEQNFERVRKQLGSQNGKYLSHAVGSIVAHAATDRALALIRYIPSGEERIMALCLGILAKRNPHWGESRQARYGYAD